MEGDASFVFGHVCCRDAHRGGVRGVGNLRRRRGARHAGLLEVPADNLLDRRGQARGILVDVSVPGLDEEFTLAGGIHIHGVGFPAHVHGQARRLPGLRRVAQLEVEGDASSVFGHVCCRDAHRGGVDGIGNRCAYGCRGIELFVATARCRADADINFARILIHIVCRCRDFHFGAGRPHRNGDFGTIAELDDQRSVSRRVADLDGVGDGLAFIHAGLRRQLDLDRGFHIQHPHGTGSSACTA